MPRFSRKMARKSQTYQASIPAIGKEVRDEEATCSGLVRRDETVGALGLGDGGRKSCAPCVHSMCTVKAEESA